MASLAKKLRITAGTHIVVLNAPRDYTRTIGDLPDRVKITGRLLKSNTFIHLFVEDKAQLERELEKTCAALAPDGLLWIGYPKGARTDLTRDKGWESLEKIPMRWLAQIAFDGHWTCFLLQNAPPKAQTKASKDYHINSSAWADPATKTVKVPADLAVKFKTHLKAKAAFQALAYTNKKEYVLWIVGAKREATRSERLEKTIAKLSTGKRNPTEK